VRREARNDLFGGRENLTQFNTPDDLIVQEMPSNILKSWGAPAILITRFITLARAMC